jgi:hypothetical protein
MVELVTIFHRNCCFCLKVWQEKGTKRNLLLCWAADRQRADTGKVMETGLLAWQAGGQEL